MQRFKLHSGDLLPRTGGDVAEHSTATASPTQGEGLRPARKYSSLRPARIYSAYSCKPAACSFPAYFIPSCCLPACFVPACCWFSNSACGWTCEVWRRSGVGVGSCAGQRSAVAASGPAVGGRCHPWARRSAAVRAAHFGFQPSSQLRLPEEGGVQHSTIHSIE